MRQLYFLIVGLLSVVSLFCAEQANPAALQKGIVHCMPIDNEDGQHMAALCGRIYKQKDELAKRAALHLLMTRNAIGSSILTAQIEVLQYYNKPLADGLAWQFPMEQKIKEPGIETRVMYMGAASDEKQAATSVRSPRADREDIVDPHTGEPSFANYYMKNEDAKCMAALCTQIYNDPSAENKKNLITALMQNPIGLSILTAQIEGLRFFAVELAEGLLESFPVEHKIKYAYAAARIGAIHQRDGRFDNAMKYYENSLGAYQMRAVLNNIMHMRKKQGDIIAALYWGERAEDSRGGDQFRSEICMNDRQDLYNPAILEGRLAKEGDDVWRDLRQA